MARGSIREYTEAVRGRYLWTVKEVYDAAHPALISETGVMGSNLFKRASMLNTYC